MLSDYDYKCSCPCCNKTVDVSIKQAGTTIECPHCKSEIEVFVDGATNTINLIDSSIQNLFRGFGGRSR